MDYVSLGKAAFRNLNRRDGFMAVTDAAGSFALPAVLASPTLVAVHETGFAECTSETLEQTGKMVLRPWGRIEGVMKFGTKPAPAGELVMLGHRQFGPGGFNYDWDVFKTETDDQGRFEFAYVPPGERQVVRLIPQGGRSWSHGDSTQVTVKPGATSQVVQGGRGRPVIGRLKPSDPAREVEWNQGHHSLMTKWPQPPKPFSSPEEARAWNNSPEGKAARETTRQYSPKFAEDGSFRVENVAAGTYDLRLHFYEAGEDGRGMRNSVGGVQREVVVPDIPGGVSDVPLDLGEITLPVQPARPRKEEAASPRAEGD
jgi:hypothetical protein